MIILYSVCPLTPDIQYALEDEYYLLLFSTSTVIFYMIDICKTAIDYHKSIAVINY
jgi:hypothetical protein